MRDRLARLERLASRKCPRCEWPNPPPPDLLARLSPQESADVIDAEIARLERLEASST